MSYIPYPIHPSIHPSYHNTTATTFLTSVARPSYKPTHIFQPRSLQNEHLQTALPLQLDKRYFQLSLLRFLTVQRQFMNCRYRVVLKSCTQIMPTAIYSCSYERTRAPCPYNGIEIPVRVHQDVITIVILSTISNEKCTNCDY